MFVGHEKLYQIYHFTYGVSHLDSTIRKAVKTKDDFFPISFLSISCGEDFKIQTHINIEDG